MTSLKYKIAQFVNSFFRSNSFIIWNENRNGLLIDCGDVEPIINYIHEHNINLHAILITHSHFDHIYGLNDFVKKQPNIPIYTSTYGKNGLLSAKLNLSKYHDSLFIFEASQNIESIEENSVITISDYCIHTFYTPGHDYSCISYKIGDFWFTGDSYLPEYKLVYNFPRSNKTLASESEQRIKSLVHIEDIICPGHGSIKSYNI